MLKQLWSSSKGLDSLFSYLQDKIYEVWRALSHLPQWSRAPELQLCPGFQKSEPTVSPAKEFVKVSLYLGCVHFLVFFGCSSLVWFCVTDGNCSTLGLPHVPTPTGYRAIEGYIFPGLFQALFCSHLLKCAIPVQGRARPVSLLFWLRLCLHSASDLETWLSSSLVKCRSGNGRQSTLGNFQTDEQSAAGRASLSLLSEANLCDFEGSVLKPNWVIYKSRYCTSRNVLLNIYF